MPLVQLAPVVIQVFIWNYILSPYQYGFKKFNQGGLANMELQWFQSYLVYN